MNRSSIEGIKIAVISNKEGASTPRVTVYATRTCGYCHAAESLLRKRNIPFERIDVTSDHQTRSWLVERTGGRMTVPVIFIDGEPIGGYDELAAMNATGELTRIIGAAA